MSKKILAVILALACVAGMMVCLAACGDKPAEETTAPETEITEEIAEEVTEDAIVPEDETAPSDAEIEDTEAEETTVAEEETTVEEGTKKPETKEEIVEYFNTAVNAVKSDSKSITRNHSNVRLNGSTTLPSSLNTIMKLLGGADSFIGGQLEKNSKGTEVLTDKKLYPVENETWSSKLTAADVSSATCTEANGQYTITLTTLPDGKSANVAHGQGHAPKAFNVILPGIVNDNIPGVATSIVGTATMDYPASTVKIVVDAETGHVLTADYDLKWTINFDEVGAILPFATNETYNIAW